MMKRGISNMRKINRTLLIIFTTALSFTIFSHINNDSYSASADGYDYSADATKKVITTTNKKVYRVTVGPYEAANKFNLVGTIKKGTYLHVSDWIMSTGGGAVVWDNYNYIPDKKHFYFVFYGQNSKWYKLATKENMKKYRMQKAIAKKKLQAKKEAEVKAEKEREKEAAAKLAQEKQAEKIKQENKAIAYAQKYPIVTTNYKITDDENILNKEGYYYFDDSDAISLSHTPEDADAYVPTSFHPKLGTTWTSGDKTYTYLDDKTAKEDHLSGAGWTLGDYLSDDDY